MQNELHTISSVKLCVHEYQVLEAFSGWRLTLRLPTFQAPVEPEMCPENGRTNALYDPQIAFVRQNLEEILSGGTEAGARRVSGEAGSGLC